ncbi:MAG: phage holin family protein [Gemmatimonas sp.]
MTLASDDLHEPRTAPPREGVLDAAAAAWKDLGDLIQAELQLLRAELSEKLRLTAVSAGLIAAGAILLLATLLLLLQAAIGALVALGLSWLTAILVVAAFTLVAGAALVWFGINNLSLRRLAPTKTIAQLQKDAKTLTRLE